MPPTEFSTPENNPARDHIVHIITSVDRTIPLTTTAGEPSASLQQPGDVAAYILRYDSVYDSSGGIGVSLCAFLYQYPPTNPAEVPRVIVEHFDDGAGSYSFVRINYDGSVEDESTLETPVNPHAKAARAAMFVDSALAAYRQLRSN